MAEKRRILIVDDDEELLRVCARILQRDAGYDVVTISDSVRALEEIDSRSYDLIISDLAMPERSGQDLLRRAHQVSPGVPFIVFSAYSSVEKAVELIHEGAFDMLEKPFKAEKLRTAVTRALQNGHRSNGGRAGLDELVGKSPVMLRVFDLIERVAPGDANITIVGESGTGKELVARSIHARSSRSQKAFVPVNCGAFPENLFESELFGYEKGAFTGAYRRKPGLLEFADQGTFFLDEICELSGSLQVKLLRMLQDRKIRRVGGTELIDVDVRIIAATNQDPERAVEEGCLREDLYYRLNVITIELPPLRDRREDIPLLANHFVEKYTKATSKVIRGVSKDALEYLINYSWPGNVRELENVIERAITLTRDEWIATSDLPDRVVAPDVDTPTSAFSQPLKLAREQVLARFEKEYLTNMLLRFRGNVTRAAKASGIDRRTFHRLLKRYDLHAKAWK